MKAEILDKIASQISALLPDQTSQDLKNNIQQILARQLSKMDVVSRDDFEAQKAVLLRTREKLEALEKQVAALEANIQP